MDPLGNNTAAAAATTTTTTTAASPSSRAAAAAMMAAPAISGASAAGKPSKLEHRGELKIGDKTYYVTAKFQGRRVKLTAAAWKRIATNLEPMVTKHKGESKALSYRVKLLDNDGVQASYVADGQTTEVGNDDLVPLLEVYRIVERDRSVDADDDDNFVGDARGKEKAGGPAAREFDIDLEEKSTLVDRITDAVTRAWNRAIHLAKSARAAVQPKQPGERELAEVSGPVSGITTARRAAAAEYVARGVADGTLHQNSDGSLEVGDDDE